MAKKIIIDIIIFFFIFVERVILPARLPAVLEGRTGGSQQGTNQRVPARTHPR